MFDPGYHRDRRIQEQWRREAEWQRERGRPDPSWGEVLGYLLGAVAIIVSIPLTLIAVPLALSAGAVTVGYTLFGIVKLIRISVDGISSFVGVSRGETLLLLISGCTAIGLVTRHVIKAYFPSCKKNQNAPASPSVLPKKTTSPRSVGVSIEPPLPKFQTPDTDSHLRYKEFLARRRAAPHSPLVHLPPSLPEKVKR